MASNATSFLFPLIIVVLGIFIITQEDSSSSSSTEEKMETTELREERLFKAEELSLYDGNTSTEIYLAVLGEVYNVTEGSAYYGPGMGYSCFAGRDGSRAFVTGNFTKEGARADLDGLTPSEVHGVVHWRDFYRNEEKYKYIGKLIGIYYDEKGNPRDEIHKDLETRLALHERNEAKKKKMEKMFPKCSSQWTQKTGKVIWCENNLVPRNFTDSLGSRARCACVHLDTDIKTESFGKFEQYENCPPNESKCYL